MADETKTPESKDPLDIILEELKKIKERQDASDKRFNELYTINKNLLNTDGKISAAPSEVEIAKKKLEDFIGGK